MLEKSCKLISYIAPAAPARRRPASGDEPFLRVEIGFTPNWFHSSLGIDFDKRWHADPSYQRETVLAVCGELRHRFPGTKIGGIDHPDKPLDLLTGIYGGIVVAAMYGMPIVYAKDNWPNCEHKYLSNKEVDKIKPLDLDENPLFQDIMSQLNWIASSEGLFWGLLTGRVF